MDFKPLFFLLLTTSLALAQGRAPVDSHKPSFIEESAQFVYRSLEDDQGGFYVVWTHQIDKEYTLVGQHVDAKGSAHWDLPGTMLVEHLKDVDNWDAFPDGKGGLIVAWVGPNGLRAQRIGSDAKTAWSQEGAVVLSTRTCASPAGVADATGGTYIVWSELRYVGRMVLVAQHLNARGALQWGLDGSRVSLRPSDQRRASVVYDGQAGAIIAWNDRREGASQIQVQRMDFQGNLLWGAQGIVVTAPVSEVNRSPLLAPIGNGGAVMAWIGPSSAVNRLFVQALDARGQLRWSPSGVEMTLGRWEQWGPVLYGDGQGHIWTGWGDYRAHVHWQVFAAMVHASPKEAGSGETPLGPSGSDQGHVTLTDDGRHGIFAAWLENRFGSTGVYVQELDSLMRRRLADQGQGVLDQLVNPSTPQIISLAPTRAAVFVADQQNKNRWALYWAAINGPPYTSPGEKTAPATAEPGAEGMSLP